MIYKKFKEKIKEYILSGVDLSLNRLRCVLKHLNNPQEDLDYIHVAGTNGKGSVCTILSHLLKESGYRVGLFISPHVTDFTERIQVNSVNIQERDFFSILEQIEPLLMNLCATRKVFLTEFELIFVISLLYFKKKNCEIVVLETGLGGRLDATNVIKKPLLCVITSISKDHTDILGDSIKKIAFEKAGIIKSGCPLVCGQNVRGKALEVIKKEAKSKGCQIILYKNTVECAHPEVKKSSADDSLDLWKHKKYKINEKDPVDGDLRVKCITREATEKISLDNEGMVVPRLGSFNEMDFKKCGNVIKNDAKKVTDITDVESSFESEKKELVVYKNSIKVLYEDYSKTIVELNGENCTINLPGRHQLENVCTSFLCVDFLRTIGFKIPKLAVKKALVEIKHPARLEILNKDPLIILDGAHNEEGINSLCSYILTHFKSKKVYGILGLLKDKFIGESLNKILPLFSKLIVTKVNNERTFKLEEIYNLVNRDSKEVICADNFATAFDISKNIMKEEDVLIIFGSLYLAEEAKKHTFISGKTNRYFN